MPPLIQPKTLGSLALKKSVILVARSCLNIEHDFGKYDNIICQQQVHLLQEYMLTEIPSLLLQEIFDACFDFDEGLDVCPFQDVRIAYALFLHKDLKRCNKSVITANDSFWISKLSSLSHLVHLNLKLNCTDAILQVVGENCPKLQYINIRSRIEPEKVTTGNALKIKYFVSDQGLLCLTKCKALRIIDMNTIIRSNFGGKLTVSGIRMLLKSLCNLQIISFMYMGDVLATGMEDVEKLSLLSVIDYNTQPHHMQAIARTCPNLKILTLRCCTVVACNRTLNVVASSALRVEALELHKYDFGVEMRDMFHAKGCFIVKLVLVGTALVSIQDVELVGVSCPNIVTFYLLDIINICNIGPPVKNLPDHLFCHLESLQISGPDWSHDVVYVCLANALNIKSIILYGTSRSLKLKSLDPVLAHIVVKNPMIQLRNICLKTGAPISMQTIEYFLNNCPQIASFCMNCEELRKNEDFLKLVKSIKKMNFDLTLQCDY